MAYNKGSYEIQVDTASVNNVIANFVKYSTRAHESANTAVKKLGEKILAESKKIVPYDMGNLQDSGTFHIDEEAGEAVIFYDVKAKHPEVNDNYAAKQHEGFYNHPSAHSRHPERGARGQRKYLEEPFKEQFPRLPELVGREIKSIKR